MSLKIFSFHLSGCIMYHAVGLICFIIHIPVTNVGFPTLTARTALLIFLMTHPGRDLSLLSLGLFGHMAKCFPEILHQLMLPPVGYV